MKIRFDFVTNSSSSSFVIMKLDNPIVDKYLKENPVKVSSLTINSLDFAWEDGNYNARLQKRLEDYLNKNPIVLMVQQLIQLRTMKTYLINI